MIAHDDPLLQSWLKVFQALEALGSRDVTLHNFREVQAEAAWHFAVGARGPDVERRPHNGPSPWLTFAKNQPANEVRLLLPLWIAERRLQAIPWSELAHNVSRDPMLRRRAHIGMTLMAHAVAHPVDWPWLRQLFDTCHPRPLLRGDEDDPNDNHDDAMGGPPPRQRVRLPKPSGSAPPNGPTITAPPVPAPAPSTRPVPGWRRPTC